MKVLHYSLIIPEASVASLERHIGRAEQAKRAEDQMYREINEAMGRVPYARYNSIYIHWFL